MFDLLKINFFICEWKDKMNFIKDRIVFIYKTQFKKFHQIIKKCDEFLTKLIIKLKF